MCGTSQDTQNSKSEEASPTKSQNSSTTTASSTNKPSKPSSGKMVICRVNLLDGSTFETEIEFWLNNEKKISKQVKGGTWVFEFQVKFYPPEPSLLNDDITRYQLCLQIRVDVYNGKLPCSFVTHALLEDFDHVIILSLIVKVKCICITRGQTPEEAELHFLENAKKLAMYGVDLHKAKDSENVDIMLGVCASGLMVYRDKLRINRFVWPKIIKLSYKRNNFYIKVRPSDMDEFENTIRFKLLNHKMAKRLWKTCVEHHTFFRLKEAEPPKTGTLFPRFNSKFRYSGRTQKQLRDKNQLMDRPQKPFDRGQYKNKSMPLDSKARSMDDVNDKYGKGYPDENDRLDHKGGVPTPLSTVGPPPYRRNEEGYNKYPESHMERPNQQHPLDATEDRTDRTLPHEDRTADTPGSHTGDTLGLQEGAPLSGKKGKKSKEDKEREKREKEEEKKRKKEEEKRKKEEKDKKKHKPDDLSTTEDRTDKLGDPNATETLEGVPPGSAGLDSVNVQLAYRKPETDKSPKKDEAKDKYGQANDKYGPGHDKYGPEYNKYGPGYDNYGPEYGDKRYGPGSPGDDKYGPGYGPESERYGKHGPGSGDNRYGPDSDKYGPGYDKYGPGYDKYGPRSPGDEKNGPGYDDRYGPGHDKYGPGYDKYGPGYDDHENKHDKDKKDKKGDKKDKKDHYKDKKGDHHKDKKGDDKHDDKDKKGGGGLFGKFGKKSHDKDKEPKSPRKDTEDGINVSGPGISVVGYPPGVTMTDDQKDENKEETAEFKSTEIVFENEREPEESERTEEHIETEIIDQQILPLEVKRVEAEVGVIKPDDTAENNPEESENTKDETNPGTSDISENKEEKDESSEQQTENTSEENEEQKDEIVVGVIPVPAISVSEESDRIKSEKNNEDVEKNNEDVEKNNEDVEKSPEDFEKSSEEVEKNSEEVDKSKEKEDPKEKKKREKEEKERQKQLKKEEEKRKKEEKQKEKERIKEEKKKEVERKKEEKRLAIEKKKEEKQKEKERKEQEKKDKQLEKERKEQEKKEKAHKKEEKKETVVLTSIEIEDDENVDKQIENQEENQDSQEATVKDDKEGKINLETKEDKNETLTFINTTTSETVVEKSEEQKVVQKQEVVTNKQEQETETNKQEQEIVITNDVKQEVDDDKHNNVGNTEQSENKDELIMQKGQIHEVNIIDTTKLRYIDESLNGNPELEGEITIVTESENAKEEETNKSEEQTKSEKTKDKKKKEKPKKEKKKEKKVKEKKDKSNDKDKKKKGSDTGCFSFIKKGPKKDSDVEMEEEKQTGDLPMEPWPNESEEQQKGVGLGWALPGMQELQEKQAAKAGLLGRGEGDGAGAGDIPPEYYNSIDRKMQFIPVTPPTTEVRSDRLSPSGGQEEGESMPFFTPTGLENGSLGKKKPPPVPPKGSKLSSEEDRHLYTESNLPPTVATEGFKFEPGTDEPPISTTNVPIVKTQTRTVTYEKDGIPVATEDSILISSSSHTTRTQTIETTKLLAAAIRSVTDMNPDLSVEKIEYMRQIEESDKK
ncbi:hypothetical protein KUTeg_016792 [Tegillarca granosa]|uniref:FERM domain-containing protein n=1 Tax=Tegillarca granosa TaxID=220873 RepID=A0ABQ9ELW9_TEGGR|nr:hypothetical protein KUTeg_016792 [Tegillarca granosa]